MEIIDYKSGVYGFIFHALLRSYWCLFCVSTCSVAVAVLRYKQYTQKNTQRQFCDLFISVLTILHPSFPNLCSVSVEATQTSNFNVVACAASSPLRKGRIG